MLTLLVFDKVAVPSSVGQTFAKQNFQIHYLNIWATGLNPTHGKAVLTLVPPMLKNNQNILIYV